MEFSSSSYTGSESLKGVPVTLLITQGVIGDREEIVVNIAATSHFPVSAEGVCLCVHLCMYVCVCVCVCVCPCVCLYHTIQNHRDHAALNYRQNYKHCNVNMVEIVTACILIKSVCISI